jgi:septal ring factor EnvC (AmiA/AmiB activator)
MNVPAAADTRMSALTAAREWLGLLAIVFSCGGFIYVTNEKVSRITDQLSQIRTEMHDLNKTVTETQLTMGKVVEHIASTDKEHAEDHERIKALESRRQQ